jgi:DNA repair protein RecO (recombination protein O)
MSERLPLSNEGNKHSIIVIAKTRGVVFRTTRYGETSIIVTIFTELFGLQTYIVNGVRSSKASGHKIALFQPLTLLDMVVYHKEHASINRIKEAKCFFACHSIATEIKKSAVSMFIQEIVNKAIREDASPAPDLFRFLLQSMITLDHQTEGYENFHLIFLLKLSHFLGFGPANCNQITGSRMLEETAEKSLSALLRSEYTDKLSISADDRRLLLEQILIFYREHIGYAGEFRSIQVLRDVLHN